MTALAPGIELRPALQRTARAGAAYVPSTLEDGFRTRLREEIHSGPFRRYEESFNRGLVRQQIDGYDVEDPMEGFPLLAELRDELVRVIRLQGKGIRGLATWRPNEVGVARYRPGSIGITPHLDGRRYRRLVAVVTVYGRARFAICRDRSGEVVRAWEAGAGDLALLRGPGLAGHRDGRPFHVVDGPRRGVRLSVGFRMSVR